MNTSMNVSVHSNKTYNLFDLSGLGNQMDNGTVIIYHPATIGAAYVIAVLILLSNLPVVISSGLILKKGQKPKSTYILLGNVSLADTILGTSILYGVSQDIKTDNPLCDSLMVFLVCPAMVSIFSVGFIAIDRYIYIVHGLHYKVWFNTTRIRIGIVMMWFTGITLSLLPIIGWRNKKFLAKKIVSKCNYTNIYPGELVLFNSFISVIPIVVVVILYSIILVKALKTVKKIKGGSKRSENEDVSRKNKPKLRMSRGTVVNKTPEKNVDKIKRSASLDLGHVGSKAIWKYRDVESNHLSRSIEYITNPQVSRPNAASRNNSQDIAASNNSVSTVFTEQNSTTTDLSNTNINQAISRFKKSIKAKVRQKEPNKWRAITVVMLTTASFIITWMPFFIVVVFYFVLCEDEDRNERCIRYRNLVSSNLCVLGFLNSLLNPLIYAWWHKGFQRTVRVHFRGMYRRCFRDGS